jgi:hypothetical protein
MLKTVGAPMFFAFVLWNCSGLLMLTCLNVLVGSWKIPYTQGLSSLIVLSLLLALAAFTAYVAGAILLAMAFVNAEKNGNMR